MVLKYNTSRAQIFTLLAVILSITLVGGASILLDETTAIEKSPAGIDSTTPKTLDIGKNVDRATQQAIINANHDSTCTRCNIESKLSTELQSTINELYDHEGVSVEISNANAVTGSVIKYNQTSPRVSTFNSSTYLTGGVMVETENVPETNNPNEGMNVTMGISSDTLKVKLYNATSSGERTNVSVFNDATGTITKKFTLRKTRIITVDVGSGTINGHKIYSGNNSYRPYTDDITTVTIGTSDTSTEPRVMLVSPAFTSTSGEPTDSGITKVTYDIEIESKYGHISQSNEVYAGGKY